MGNMSLHEVLNVQSRVGIYYVERIYRLIRQIENLLLAVKLTILAIVKVTGYGFKKLKKKITFSEIPRKGFVQ